MGDEAPAFVYVLRSLSAGRLYIGSAADVDVRLCRHNAGHSKSTKAFRPWVVVHSERWPTRSDAVRRELFLKTGRGRDELKRLISKTDDTPGAREIS